jgi:DNA-binding transcriptional LysR family regulator
MADDLDAIAVFVAVADAKGFRAAGDRLGVSASAVSQSLRKLEDRLGVVLVQRTTRSVRLTAAGEQLHASVRPALEEVRSAIAAVGELSREPRGNVRLVVASGAEHFLGDEMLARFLAEHPRISLDLAVSNEVGDIVASGYDAGIQLGEVIDRDMVAVPVSGDLKLLVVGAPAYFTRHRKPRHPRDLVEHECVNWHRTPDAPAYRWEFTEHGRDFAVAVPTRVLTTDPVLLVRLARAGVGLAMVYEDQVRGEIARRELVPVLEDFSTPFPGFYLYYPERRHASPALRAFIDYLREARGGARRKRGRRGSAAKTAARR